MVILAVGLPLLLLSQTVGASTATIVTAPFSSAHSYNRYYYQNSTGCGGSLVVVHAPHTNITTGHVSFAETALVNPCANQTGTSMFGGRVGLSSVLFNLPTKISSHSSFTINVTWRIGYVVNLTANMTGCAKYSGGAVLGQLVLVYWLHDVTKNNMNFGTTSHRYALFSVSGNVATYVNHGSLLSLHGKIPYALVSSGDSMNLRTWIHYEFQANSCVPNQSTVGIAQAAVQIGGAGSVAGLVSVAAS